MAQYPTSQCSSYWIFEKMQPALLAKVSSIRPTLLAAGKTNMAKLTVQEPTDTDAEEEEED